MITTTSIPARHSLSELFRWYIATWEDYVACVEMAEAEHFRIFLNQGWLFVDMGWEGVDHARFRELLAMLFFAWFSQRSLGESSESFDCLGGCI